MAKVTWKYPLCEDEFEIDENSPDPNGCPWCGEECIQKAED